MADVRLVEAKAHLSELVERARKGEEVTITRRGKKVARIVAVERVAAPIDLAALRAMTAKMKRQEEPARTWLRHVRDDARY